jgi:hypothetical protein
MPMTKAEINRRHYLKRVAKARKASEGKARKVSKSSGLKPVVKPDLIEYDRFPQLSRPTFVQKDRFSGLDIPIFI